MGYEKLSSLTNQKYPSTKLFDILVISEVQGTKKD